MKSAKYKTQLDNLTIFYRKSCILFNNKNKCIWRKNSYFFYSSWHILLLANSPGIIQSSYVGHLMFEIDSNILHDISGFIWIIHVNYEKL